MYYVENDNTFICKRSKWARPELSDFYLETCQL